MLGWFSGRDDSRVTSTDLTMTPYTVPCRHAPKLRELEARLKSAGFIRQAAKGSHRKWVHPQGRYVVLSGGAGDDAKKYQETQVQEAIDATSRES